MWGPGFTAACGFAIGALVLVTDVSAFAGTRLYDMNRLLSQPHPYQNHQTTPMVAGARPTASTSGGRRVWKNTAPLPGSRYRVAVPNAASPSPAIYRPTSQQAVPASPPAIAMAPNAPVPLGKPAMRPGKRSFISEIVVGGFSHDPGENNNEANSWDLNLEVVFRKIIFLTFENRYLKFLFSPNPILGGTINSDNETHTAYLALNWQHRFENRVFVAGSFGFTVHTGNLEQAEEDCPVGTTCSLPGNRRFVSTGDVTLGSRILFRESFELGYWVAQRHALSVYFAHMSNASIFDEDNDGMNFVGLRYRYAFD